MPAQSAPLQFVAIGDIRLTYLPDGDGRLGATTVFPASDDALWEAHREFLDADGMLLVSIGAFLIETGDRKVVVDLGFGDAEVPFPGVGVFKGGRLMDSLRQAGVAPGDVDTVVYTHLHLDHVGWTAGAGGALTFPNASHLAGSGEWDFWRAATDETLVAVGPHPEAVQPALQSQLEALGDGASVAPGITAIATPGHTPGHISLVVSSGTDRALIMGDAIHCPLQFDERDLSIMFDLDAELAKRTRQRIAAELEQPQTIGANGHFADTVFGRVLPGQGKTWHTMA